MSRIAPPLAATGKQEEQGRLSIWEMGPWLVVGAMVLSFAIGFSWLSILRHEAFQSHAFDLGNMDQAAWNTAHGHLLRFTDMAVGQRTLTTRLAIHVEPILVPLALLYYVHEGPETLLIVQAAVVALGAVPAYLIGQRWTGSTVLSLVFPAAYLLHPSVQNAVLDDFHAVTLAACFLLWALFFLLEGLQLGYVVAAILAMSTKEDIGLLIAMMGVVLIVRRRPALGLASILGGCGWFLVSVLVIIPRFNPSGHSPYLGRYAYLGHGLGGILAGVVHHPSIVAHVITSPGRVSFLNDLLHPLAYSSIVGFPVLLLALPSFAIDMLSSDSRMYSGFYQYPMEIVPFVVAASAVGIGLAVRLARLHTIGGARWIGSVLALLVLVASIVDSRLYGFSPLASGYVVPSVGPHQSVEKQLLRLIPSDVPVAAADEIEPHVSDRLTAYLLPTIHPLNGPPARYIVLDASIPSLPVTPRTLRGVVTYALRNGYGIVGAQDGVMVLRKGAERSTRVPRPFYSFIFTGPAWENSERVRWGSLRLAGVTIHPRSLSVNRSRPAISLETYWQTSKPLSGRARIAVYVSPVYRGHHPGLSRQWHVLTDSPTWDWWRLNSWPLRRIIHASLIPFAPSTLSSGQVDLAVGVAGAGQMTGESPATRISGARSLFRVATVEVDG